MSKGVKILSTLILIILYSYFLKKYYCKELKIPYVDSGSSLNETMLSYTISYGEESFTVEGTYDILFLARNSSTNGVPLLIHGKYGEPVKSEELYLRGSNSFKTHGGLSSFVKESKKYYVAGTVNRPDDDHVRKQNEKALSIHVEEHYNIDYAW